MRTKHERLTRTLRELVSRLSPGVRLPSQAELMRQYRVSDRTVLRSLEDLRRDGVIVRRRGSGTFVADPIAQPGLRSPSVEGRTVAALALSTSPSPFYQWCLSMLAQAVEAAGWSLVCHHARHEPASGDALLLEALNPRGFVALNFALYPLARQLQERGRRTVILGSPPTDVHLDVPNVSGDHEVGGYLATRHLLELGHRRLAYLRLAPTWRTSLHRSLRWRGHERAISDARQAGGDVSCVLLAAAALSPWRRNPALAASYFRRRGAPTAVIAWNDGEAIPFLSILEHAGLRVPADLSVIGYDALPAGAECLPALTTVDQHLDCQLRAVIGFLSREPPPPRGQSVVVVPTLVVRASCGPPPSSSLEIT